MATKVKHICPHTNRKILAKGKCKYCYWEEYVKKQRQKLIVPRGTISQVSTQRDKLNKIYTILCKELKPQHTKCETNLPGCTHKATEIHHMKGRRGLLLILSKYFAYHCPNCHRWVTDHSKEAVEIGLSLPINSQTEYDFTERELFLIDKYGVKTKITLTLK